MCEPLVTTYENDKISHSILKCQQKQIAVHIILYLIVSNLTETFILFYFTERQPAPALHSAKKIFQLHPYDYQLPLVTRNSTVFLLPKVFLRFCPQRFSWQNVLQQKCAAFHSCDQQPERECQRVQIFFCVKSRTKILLH